MKRVKIKPRLVDHNLFKPIPIKLPIPAIKQPIKPSKPLLLLKPSTDLSSMFNLIGLLILAIGGFYMYQRFTDKPQTDVSKKHAIIGFNQYVNESLKEPGPTLAN